MSNIYILQGDCRELSRQLPSESVDMIFTDPPYPKDFLPLFEWLSVEAARLLKPGGYLITYSGQHWLKYVMDALNCNLEYFWIIAGMHRGPTRILPGREVTNQWKPLLIYSKGKPGPHELFLDSISGTRSKQYHEWGQSEETASYYISCFTHPGDTVLEPFCGGGTTPYVCAQIDRECIAFEIDPAAYKVSLDRITRIQERLIPVESLQSELWVLQGGE